MNAMRIGILALALVAAGLAAFLARSLVTSDQTRSIFSKPVRRRSRTRWIIQAMKGRGKLEVSAGVDGADAYLNIRDSGPGIPEEALTKIFNRFYSERPEQQFGNNSGLGLAISKQIVEAHGGVIWAENIRPTEADITSDPLGARFVVGLPV